MTTLQYHELYLALMLILLVFGAIATRGAEPGPRFIALLMVGANVVYYLLQVLRG